MSEPGKLSGPLSAGAAAVFEPAAEGRLGGLMSGGGGDLRVDLCVIGAGAGGLSVAAAAAQLGVSVALVEKGRMGGDCLNTGCVPSKALIAAARRAHEMRTAGAFGVSPVRPAVDFRALHGHIHGVIDAIAPNDSVERFTGLGVKVVKGEARFVGKDTVVAADLRIRARRFVIATGSSPAIPAIPGLSSVPYLTNETLFEDRDKRDHLIIIGGGAIGVEMAQAHARLGCRVTLIEALKVLGRDDPEISELVVSRLVAEGVDIREGAHVERVSGGTNLIDVQVTQNGVSSLIQGSDLLIATGRLPNVAGLDLETAGIKYDKRGIKVNRGLVTSNRRVFAIGDVVGGMQHTHVASYHAGIVIRRALFRLPAKVNDDLVPWVTFTDPEIAHVGLTEDAARRRHGKVKVLRWPMHENDRAQTERATLGHAKVVTTRSGRIVGASIVGTHAGELIQMWSLAVSQGMNIKAMTQWISPYPTYSEVNRRLAIGYYAAAATNPFVRKLVGWLAKLG
ncbi:MAG: FAD-dependent oxidoreductase [Hyphomicrobiaceae bacterium]|nr:FAD-dependent oxidoreductase [Hyphomicrobiaceae bacterium]